MHVKASRRAAGVIAIAALLALAGTAAAVPGAAPRQTVGSPRANIAAMLESGNHPWLRRADLADVRDSLRAFYSVRDHQPCWVSAGHPTPRAWAWVNALGGIDEFGLDLADLSVPALRESAMVLDRGSPRSQRSLAEFDVALSATVVRTLDALHGGRLEPALVDSTLIRLHRPLAIGRLLDTLSVLGNPRVWLEGVQPPFRQYHLLRRALGLYRAAAADPTLLPATRPVTRLRAKRPLAEAPALRRLLSWTGDLRDSLPPAGTRDTVLDARLIEAVGRFQRRHDLDTKQGLNAATWTQLERGLDERVHQIERNMELWRWLPHNLRLPLLLVNIPAFRLKIIDRFDQSESSMFRMDVVVGRAFQSQTPLFTAALTSIDFAPGWDVPPGIARDEIRPDALADSTYLERNAMDLIRDRKVIPATRGAIDSIGMGVRVRQRPGELSALGRVKFVMPNRYDVYMHDTPARHVFAQRQRDMSHGCIRVADPPRLAKRLLRDRSDWTAARIDSALAGDSASAVGRATAAAVPKRTVKVRIPTPMLVAIVYATAEARESGKVSFFPDVYGHDRAMGMLLSGVSPDSVAAERRRAIQAKRAPSAASVPPPPP